jgi:hypothetical protein
MKEPCYLFQTNKEENQEDVANDKSYEDNADQDDNDRSEDHQTSGNYEEDNVVHTIEDSDDEVVEVDSEHTQEKTSTAGNFLIFPILLNSANKFDVIFI